LRYDVAMAALAENKLLDLQVIGAAFVGGEDYSKIAKMLKDMMK